MLGFAARLRSYVYSCSRNCHLPRVDSPHQPRRHCCMICQYRRWLYLCRLLVDLGKSLRHHLHSMCLASGNSWTRCQQLFTPTTPDLCRVIWEQDDQFLPLAFPASYFDVFDVFEAHTGCSVALAWGSPMTRLIGHLQR